MTSGTGRKIKVVEGTKCRCLKAGIGTRFDASKMEEAETYRGLFEL